MTRVRTLVVVYLAAIVCANLSVAIAGPKATILNAFLFVGLDLTSRDSLHDHWRGRRLVTRMAALIVAGGLISYLLNHDAGPIAIASCIAFAAAATVDTLAYWALRRHGRLLRINGSNIPAALTDSLLFPTIAFGALLWPIILGQFAAKALGGFVWSLLLNGKAVSRALPGEPHRAEGA